MAVLPIYNTLLVPDANVFIKTDYYRAMTGKNPVLEERVILVVTRQELSREELADDSFYPIGLTGSISEVNQSGYLVIHTKNRINLVEVSVLRDHSIDLAISRRPDKEDLDQEGASERLHALKARIASLSDQFKWGPMVRSYLSRWTNIGEIAASFSPWLVITNQERYDILAEDSLQNRFDRMEKVLYETLEMTRLGQEARSAQEEDHQKIYRESAIKKQMQYLQKELDELHPENVSDLRKLELRLEQAGLNEEARREADKVLSRLKQENNGSPESGMLYDYLDYMASLPWKKEKPQHISLDEAERILKEDHYGLEKVRKRILQQIAVMSLRRQQSGSILLFVGAPGTGKTSIGQSIARSLGRKYVRVSLGGVRDEADIRGHRRTYIGAMAGRILDGIAKSGVSNPVMVLDEVDKLSMSYNGDPASALLEVLDPEQNSTFTDHYLNVPFDLSDVFFICTANTTETIPEPLLNRMEVIPFQGYTPLDKFEIARRHLLPKAMKSVGLLPDDLTVTDEAIRHVISDYTREAGVRGLKKRLDTLCRSAAVEFVRHTDIPAPDEAAEQAAHDPELTAEGPAAHDRDLISDEQTAHDPEFTANGPAGSEGNEDRSSVPAAVHTQIVIGPEDLRGYLDSRPLTQGIVPASAGPGIVTGLAWTSAGGDVLYIETMFTKGEGRVLITGQLGDVMKESAQLAISLVKYMYPDKAELFEKNTLHIHVPDGATPKDGPSAGITLTTALASLVTGTAVSPQIAMTGEVSLQGNVKPIGGLPEKLMAAQRAGVKKVFIPKENEDDLRDVAAEIRDELTIVPVSRVTDVLGALELLPVETIAQAG